MFRYHVWLGGRQITNSYWKSFSTPTSASSYLPSGDFYMLSYLGRTWRSRSSEGITTQSTLFSRLYMSSNLCSSQIIREGYHPINIVFQICLQGSYLICFFYLIRCTSPQNVKKHLENQYLSIILVLLSFMTGHTGRTSSARVKWPRKNRVRHLKLVKM